MSGAPRQGGDVMRSLTGLLASVFAVAAIMPASAAAQMNGQKSKPIHATIASTLDAQLTVREKQIVPAAEAMPADEYSFVPDGDTFKGSRTFALEVKHVAATNVLFFSEILGQAPPPGVSWDGTMNGPDDLQKKDQIVQFLKDSFALGHKAIATITEKNALTPISDPNLPISQHELTSRLALAGLACMHVSDHYGQIVVYLRMNGIIPPASQGQPPANPHS
jgi:hypothetical protein